MISEVLKEKLILNKTEEENTEYSKNFYISNIKNTPNKLSFKGKIIFINHESDIEFKHIISIGDDGEGKKGQETNLCVNTSIESLCQNQCDFNKLIFPQKRMFCIYRAEKLPWLVLILNGIKDNNNSITNNLKIFNYNFEKNGKDRTYIRYQEVNSINVVDYIIILEEMEKYYKLITAYPVIFKGTRRQYDSWNDKYLKSPKK